MSAITIIKLNWSAATHDTGIRLYNIYQDDLMVGQTTDLTYQINDVEAPMLIKYYVVALTNSDEYLKSNVIELQTTVSEGSYVLDYTLDFGL